MFPEAASSCWPGLLGGQREMVARIGFMFAFRQTLRLVLCLRAVQEQLWTSAGQDSQCAFGHASPHKYTACRSMLERRVRLDVFDRDRSKDAGEPLGWAYYNLDLVAEGQVSEQWVQLRNVFAGELRIRVLVLSGTDDNAEVRLRSQVLLYFFGALLRHWGW